MAKYHIFLLFLVQPTRQVLSHKHSKRYISTFTCMITIITYWSPRARLARQAEDCLTLNIYLPHSRDRRPGHRHQKNHKRATSFLYCRKLNSQHIKFSAHVLLHTKKDGIIWEFFPNGSPPPPLLGTPYSKKNWGLFCILGPQELFWFSQKS